jgi:Uma2 family endonuclease
MAAQEQTTLPPHRLDVETYNRIVDSGALEGRHVELLDGLLVEMGPHSPAHATVVGRLQRHLGEAGRWWLRVQSPLEVPPRSEPEPDLAAFAEEPPPDRHPRTALLVIEVAVTSQLIDRNVKAARYAQAAIPTYWLVDVPRSAVEARTQPGPQGYERCEIYTEGAKVPCPLVGVADLDIAALLEGVTS